MNVQRGRKGNVGRPASPAPVRSAKPPVAKGKGLIRSLVRGFARTGQAGAVEAQSGHLSEPAVCEHCGAIFIRRAWRRDRRLSLALFERARWTTCPGCSQARTQTGFGRVLVRGAFAQAHEDVIRRRIANVAARARHTQPERQLASVERSGDALEIITTSQKLAHRIVRELKKLFRGRVSYAWSDDGTLFATWTRER
jgi:NMD protein affecting ribosome stability and mRNA decay